MGLKSMESYEDYLEDYHTDDVPYVSFDQIDWTELRQGLNSLQLFDDPTLAFRLPAWRLSTALSPR